MKKSIVAIVAVVFLSISGLCAQRYKTALGGVLGMNNGVSLKHFFTENVAIQADLGFGIKYAPAKLGYGHSILMDCWDFQINPNVVYQADISGAFAGYIGAGISLGEVNDYYYNDCVGGLFGVNAILGVEYNFSQPISLGFDFRPGYGLFFSNYDNVSAFDWSLNLSIRYRF